MISKVAPAGADTGLAVWFEKRDRQWLAGNLTWTRWLLALVTACCAYSVMMAMFMAAPGLQGHPSLAWLPFQIAGGALFIALLLILIYALQLRMQYLMPPEEMIAAISGREFYTAIRRKFASVSWAMVLWVLLPLDLVNLILQYWPEVRYGEKHLQFLLSIAASQVIYIAGLALISHFVGIYLPRLAPFFRVLVVLMTIVVVIGIPLAMDFFIYQPQWITTFDAELSNRIIRESLLTFAVWSGFCLLLLTALILRNPARYQRN